MPQDAGAGSVSRNSASVPRRWTLHGLNNGAIFTATLRGVTFLPRRVSYAIGNAGTWIAWRTMTTSRRAVADNLAALFPGEPAAVLERRALETFRAYARDAIDFIRALSELEHDPGGLFEVAEPYGPLFEELRARGKGVILVTGHWGNWEAGSVLFRSLGIPLTIVAMAEADPEVNRIRREMREKLGADTIEVRQSLDTALQIRRRLAGNEIVAMLVDRHYGRDRVPVTLLARQAYFLRTPLLMGYLTGAPVLPCTVERTGTGRFAIKLGDPIFVPSSLPRDAAVADAAQRVALVLEERIRARPECWYQFYRYWDAQRDSYDGLD